jgi:hypothetical protein
MQMTLKITIMAILVIIITTIYYQYYNFKQIKQQLCKKINPSVLLINVKDTRMIILLLVNQEQKYFVDKFSFLFFINVSRKHLLKRIIPKVFVIILLIFLFNCYLCQKVNLLLLENKFYLVQLSSYFFKLYFWMDVIIHK